MSRFLILAFVAVNGVLAFGVMSAKAQGVEDFSYNLTLAPVEATSQPAAPVTFHFTGMIQWRLGTSGSYRSWTDYATDNGFDPFSDGVEVAAFQEGSPIGTHDATLDSGGSFADAWTISTPGTYTFVAETTQWKDNGDDIDTVDVSSDPVTVTVGVRPVATAEPGETMLCYSHLSISTPSGYLFTNGKSLLASGYFIPYAISRATAVQRGIPAWAWTNYGNYVLACNVDGLKATGLAVDGSGGIWGPEAIAAYIAYWTPPLNLYPIYG